MTAPDAGIDSDLLESVRLLAEGAGRRLLDVYDPDARPADRAEMLAAAVRNERVASEGLLEALISLRPQARVVNDDLESVALPDDGEWWVVDDAEGSVNHVHGRPEWGVSIALLKAHRPVLAVFHQPVGGLSYTAVLGLGAHLNGVPLRVSSKRGLDIAVVGTGQAEADQSDTYRRIGESITAMLRNAFLVSATVPSTFPMVLVATGRMDAFWQYEPVLPGVAAGALLIGEAGGVVSTIDGAPWLPGSGSVLVGAPGVHPAVRDVLATIA